MVPSIVRRVAFVWVIGLPLSGRFPAATDILDREAVDRSRGANVSRWRSNRLKPSAELSSRADRAELKKRWLVGPNENLTARPATRAVPPTQARERRRRRG
jgi:hypothetical protein